MVPLLHSLRIYLHVCILNLPAASAPTGRLIRLPTQLAVVRTLHTAAGQRKRTPYRLYILQTNGAGLCEHTEIRDLRGNYASIRRSLCPAEASEPEAATRSPRLPQQQTAVCNAIVMHIYDHMYVPAAAYVRTCVCEAPIARHAVTGGALPATRTRGRRPGR